MRPEPGQVLHFSEDPTVRRFRPHVAATARQAEAYVWAVDAEHAPSYWFPRQCPRVLAWPGPETTAADRERVAGPGGGDRVDAVEYGWLERLRTIAERAVDPLGPPEPVGDLLERHAEAGIQVRVLPEVRTFFDAVVASTMRFSGIRLHHARPR